MEENHSCTRILRVAEWKPERICEQLGSLIQTDGLEISLPTLALALSAVVVAPHERGRAMGIIGKHLLNLLAFAFPLQSQCQETQARLPALETGCWLASLECSPAGLSRPGRYAHDRLDVGSLKAMYAERVADFAAVM